MLFRSPPSSAPKFTPPIVASRPLPAPPRQPTLERGGAPEAPVASSPEIPTEPAPEQPPDKELSEMDLRAVKVILEEIDDHLEGGLLSVDIISKASGMSLAGIGVVVLAGGAEVVAPAGVTQSVREPGGTPVGAPVEIAFDRALDIEHVGVFRIDRHGPGGGGPRRAW